MTDISSLSPLAILSGAEHCCFPAMVANSILKQSERDKLPVIQSTSNSILVMVITKCSKNIIIMMMMKFQQFLPLSYTILIAILSKAIKYGVFY